MQNFFPIILTDLNMVWAQVLHLGTPMSFSAHSFLPGNDMGAGKTADGIYYIRRGLVRLSSLSQNGQERAMLYMGKNMLFNEIPMLLYSRDYVFTCMEQSETVFWPKKFLTEKLIKERPELFINLLESMGKKTQTYYSQLSASRYLSALGNVCRVLYSMHLFNRIKGEIVPQVTQQELAAFLGIHRSSLHKALSRLKDEGIIGHYSRKHLVLYKEKALRAYAEDPRED